MSTQDYDRLVKAIRSYAYHSPIDMTPPGAIQRDLLAISGLPHTHVASIGSDRCLLCHRDLRDSVHVPPVPDPVIDWPRPSCDRKDTGLRYGDGLKLGTPPRLCAEDTVLPDDEQSKHGDAA